MKWTYWISTSLISLVLILSSWTYLMHQSTIEGILELGFPDFFRVQLAILKILAVVVILGPNVPLRVKEWAYAGTGLFFLTAIVAHAAHGDPIFITLANVLLIAVLLISYVSLHKLAAQKTKTPADKG